MNTTEFFNGFKIVNWNYGDNNEKVISIMQDGLTRVDIKINCEFIEICQISSKGDLVIKPKGKNSLIVKVINEKI